MTLAAIKKLRAGALTSLLLTLALFIFIGRNPGTLSWIAFFAHASLFVFVVTETFGPIARTRSPANKMIARMVFCIYALLIFSVVVFSIAQAIG